MLFFIQISYVGGVIDLEVKALKHHRVITPVGRLILTDADRVSD